MNWFTASLTAAALAAGLGAQSPPFRLSTAVAKESKSFLIRLDASAGNPTVALQCDLVVPAAVTVTLNDIQLGSAAATAGKKLNCAAAKASGVRYTCVLAGGAKEIPNGPILVVYYAPPKQAGGPPVRIAIEKVLGVTAAGKAIPAPDTDAILGSR
jgi:hypothetical protein